MCQLFELKIGKSERAGLSMIMSKVNVDQGSTLAQGYRYQAASHYLLVVSLSRAILRR
jgi:hypothetical protein